MLSGLIACLVRSHMAYPTSVKGVLLVDSEVLLVKNARDEWVKNNGCTMDNPMTTMVKGGSCEYYMCPGDGQVALCSFITPANHATDAFAGHAWSGGAAGQPFSISETESAAELGWAFFKKYAW